MRTLFLSPLLLLSANASADTSPPANRLTPPAPILAGRDELTDQSASKVCRDRIDETREERGLPKLDKAAPDTPLLIAAVDERIGGCSVLVMRNNLADVRPLPQFQDGPAKLSPLNSQ